MAAVTPVASALAFLKGLEKSQLLAGDALKAAQEAAAKASEPKQLARDLVKNGTLTKWQAGQLLYGYYVLTVGKYKLLDQLGSGEMGRVYLAEHAQMARRHTLKILSRRHTADRDALKRFLSDAERASGLDHPSISRIFDINNDGDRYFVVMEYVEGQDLQKLVEQEGALKPPRAIDLMRQAAEGLAYAHAAGVVHGDLKPSNLVVDAGGLLKILDIGQARLTETRATEAIDDSQETGSLASGIFHAPEQRDGQAGAEAAADIYSLGSVLCFLLTGKAVADANEAAKELTQAKGVPPELADLCRRLMATDAASRPASMAVVNEELAKQSKSSPLPPPVPAKKPDSSAGKPKKPPVAKSLPADKAEKEQAATEPAASEDDPFAGFKLDLGSRGRKAAPAAAAAPVATDTAAKAEPAQAKAPPPAKKAISTPLLIAGGIGGGVLVLGGLAALAAYLLFGGDETRIAAAQAKPSATPVAAAAALADEESNPVEANPSVDVVPASVSNPVTEPAASSDEPAPASAPPAAPANAAGPKTADVAKAANGPPAEAPPAEPPAEPAAATGKKPEPDKPPEPAGKAEPAKKADPKAASKAEPAKAAAKPEKKKEEDPFAGFAKTVSLPELPLNGEPPSDVMAPLVLGPCKVDAKALVLARLKGGETLVRGRQKFDLQPVGGTALQDWEFQLISGEATEVVATLGVKEGNLVFQWTPQGAKQAAIANLLRNCALDVAAGPKQLILPLRKPAEGPPLTIELARPSAEVEWSVDYLPDERQVFVAVTNVAGLERKRITPEEGAPAGDDITIWTGPADDAMYLGVLLKPSVSTKDISVRSSLQVRIEGIIPKPTRFNEKQLAGMLKQMNAQSVFVGNAAKFAAEKADSKKKEQIQKDAKNRINSIDTQAEKVRNLLGFTAELSPTVHFRVYYLADDAQVDLLVTTGGEEAADPNDPAAEQAGKDKPSAKKDKAKSGD